MRSALRCSAALALMGAIAITGCGERVDITGSGGSPRTGGRTATGGTSGSTATDQRLIGQWSRTVLFQDNSGAVQSSRTTWRFRSDASATRSVVASNLTFGFVDSVVTHARWRIQGGRLALSFLAPASGDVLFDYRFDGATLVLGGLPFERQ